MVQLTQRAEWKALTEQSGNINLREAFQKDPQRAEKFVVATEGLVLDYSKNLIDENIMQRLINLAKSCDIESWREAMFAGEKINNTENRSVLHTALRRPAEDVVVVDGENVIPYIHETLLKMKNFAERVRGGNWLGYTGKAIKHIVSIGIGGSDLGPVMVYESLKSFSDRNLNMYFVSNVDGTHIAETLRELDPETTLFLVASKTFTTQETLRNAETAKAWLIKKLGHSDAVAKHFIALSTNEEAVTSFGIDPENMFPFREWVGGRYSLWSSIGMPIAIALGAQNFQKLLDGAYAMDMHFRKTPLENNMPVIMAMLGILYRNVYNFGTYAVLPYDQYMHRFPAFLQQMDMESNGKTVDREGVPVNYATGPIVFGEPGTNGQHSFYQLIHQGPDVIPCDFMFPVKSQNPVADGDHHQKLAANVFAQARALAFGQTLEEAAGKPCDVFEGNRPSNMLIVPEINPFHLGQLIALYENKVFVQGVIWNLNSYDQPGVQLGKVLANQLLEIMNGNESDETLDSSTRNLLKLLS